ncbi:MAG TPA: hypothetical protein VE287_01180 [Actinopolymorphaceae bacterium]|nr:hypothetical protein [Actinopolymorphaceae bacterium]
MTTAQREARLMAYQALQEALDRRDNGGRSSALDVPRARFDERDVDLVPAGAANPSR